MRSTTATTTATAIAASTSQRVRLHPRRGCVCSSRNVAMSHSFPPHLKAEFLREMPHRQGPGPNLTIGVCAILSEVKRQADPYRDLDVIDSRALDSTRQRSVSWARLQSQRAGGGC